MPVTCEFCEHEMAEGEGCREKKIEFGDGAVVKAVQYGNEERFDPSNQPTDEMEEAMREVAKHDDRNSCHDCNAGEGEYHHPGCDWEECPRCGGQLLSCECPSPVTHVADG